MVPSTIKHGNAAEPPPDQFLCDNMNAKYDNRYHELERISQSTDQTASWPNRCKHAIRTAVDLQFAGIRSTAPTKIRSHYPARATGTEGAFGVFASQQPSTRGNVLGLKFPSTRVNTAMHSRLATVAVPSVTISLHITIVCT